MNAEIGDLLKSDFGAAFFAKKYKRRFSGKDLTNPAVAFSVYLSFVSRDHLDPNEGFSEEFYLHANPDVMVSVESGTLISGFQHWIQYGRQEGRASFWALTFDGSSGIKKGILINGDRPSGGENGRILCLSIDDYAEMRKDFDVEFFSSTYKARFDLPKSEDSQSLFEFYLSNTIREKIDPNPNFSEEFYLNYNSDIYNAIREGAYLSGFHHWVRSGRNENRICHPNTVGLNGRFNQVTNAQKSLFKNLFQPHYYSEHPDLPANIKFEDLFSYFIEFDLMKGVIPVDQNMFDEDFYVMYYADVQKYKRERVIPSGYYHYVILGQAEGRQPTYNSALLLKAKLGDAADPVGTTNIVRINDRLKPIELRINAERKRCLNIFVPTLDGDLMFGGYIAFLHFLCRIAESGHRLRFIIREDPYGSRDWFFKGIENRPRWLKAFKDQEVINATNPEEAIEFSKDDLCIAYSAWTMFDASAVAKNLACKMVIFFIQEYEPIFHENNSFNFMMASVYSLPHLPIFNSSLLKDFFLQNKIGVFSAEEDNPPPPKKFFSKTNINNSLREIEKKYLCFEHAITSVDLDYAALTSAGRAKRLICYARPEKHAGRNLFEVCILALREAIERGVFTGDWEFFGIGSLGTDYELDIGPGRTIKILSRMSQNEYETFLKSFDVGISLMWAPHPSVMPFELAKAGVVTVTNVYGTRDRRKLEKFGHNIVPSAATIEGIVNGLQVAVSRSTNMEARRKGAQFDWPTSWDTVFTPVFIDQLFYRVEIAQKAYEDPVDSGNRLKGQG
jgi:hypothetical protein